MTMTKIQCKHCGDTDPGFYAVETITWRVNDLIEDNTVTFTRPETDETDILCQNCDAPADLPEGVQYNFQ